MTGYSLNLYIAEKDAELIRKIANEENLNKAVRSILNERIALFEGKTGHNELGLKE